MIELFNAYNDWLFSYPDGESITNYWILTIILGMAFGFIWSMFVGSMSNSTNGKNLWRLWTAGLPVLFMLPWVIPVTVATGAVVFIGWLLLPSRKPKPPKEDLQSSISRLENELGIQ